MAKSVYYEFRENQFDMCRKRNELIARRERERAQSKRSYAMHTPVTFVTPKQGCKRNEK